MATSGNVVLTGQDTIQINGRIFNNFADKDVGDLTFPEKIADVKIGKNGNAIFAYNASGLRGELKLRLIRGSADDIFLNNLLAQQQSNFSGFVLMYGEFVKNLGDGAGNQAGDTYVMGGGVFTKIPEVKSNVEGDTDQGVTEWMIDFANNARAIT